MNIKDYLDSTYLKTAEQAGISESENIEIVSNCIQEAIDERFKLVMIRPEMVSLAKKMILKEKSKLNIGAKATGKYASVEEVNYMNKESLIIQFEKTYDTFIQSFEKCSEKKLDICRVPHPILGKISLRELAYFTIFHTQHHIESIQKMNNDK